MKQSLGMVLCTFTPDTTSNRMTLHKFTQLRTTQNVIPYIITYSWCTYSIQTISNTILTKQVLYFHHVCHTHITSTLVTHCVVCIFRTSLAASIFTSVCSLISNCSVTSIDVVLLLCRVLTNCSSSNKEPWAVFNNLYWYILQWWPMIDMEPQYFVFQIGQLFLSLCNIDY